MLLDAVQPYAAKVVDLGQTVEAQNTFLQVRWRLPTLPWPCLGSIAGQSSVSNSAYLCCCRWAISTAWAACTARLRPSVGGTLLLQEASMLRRLRHRNVVGFRGVCIHEGQGIILMVSGWVGVGLPSAGCMSHPPLQCHMRLSVALYEHALCPYALCPQDCSPRLPVTSGLSLSLPWRCL